MNQSERHEVQISDSLHFPVFLGSTGQPAWISFPVWSLDQTYSLVLLLERCDLF